MKDAIDLIQISSLVAILYAIGFVAFWGYTVYRRSLKEKKKTYTFDFCRSDSRNYEVVFNIKNEYIFSNEQRVLLESQQADALQFFEKVAVGIKNGLLEEKIIFECYQRYFRMAQQKLKFAFLEYSKNNEDPYIYIEFFRLLNRWESSKEFNHV